jgi:membrane-associated phospholipid phosphatase
VDADVHAVTVTRPQLESRDRDDAPRSVPPVLEPRPNGPADRFSQRFGPENPVRVFIVALLAGYALLVTAMVFLGLVLIHVLLPVGGLGEADEDFSQWLADNRSPTQEDVSWVGSTLSGGHVIPAVLGIGLVTFLIMRRWILAAFVVLVVAVESATYRVTSLIVERERPDVERLESLPVDASYPSGHTAAAVAMYGGLLLLLASRFENSVVRIVAIVLGVAIPLFVSWARLYRGMHHFSDVVAGLLMGLGALVILVFAARAARASTDRRDGVGIAADGGAA